MVLKRMTVLAVTAFVSVVTFGGMPINPKLPMSFGVNSKGGNRFVGEFKNIELTFGGKTYHAGPAKVGDRVKPFPTESDAKKGMRFACRFVTKNAAVAQRLLDNVTPGKGDGFTLIFLDPPYALDAVGDAILRILSSKVAKPGCLFVCESGSPDLLGKIGDAASKFDVLKEARYGITYITLLRYRGEEGEQA